LIIHQQISIHN